MNQLEINEIIREIHEKLYVLSNTGINLINFENLNNFYKNIDNANNEWEYFYHLPNERILIDWLAQLSDLYYLYDHSAEEKINQILSNLEKISSILIDDLKNIDIKDFNNIDKNSAENLRKFLRQFKNYYYLTNNVESFKKEIQSLQKEMEIITHTSKKVVEENKEIKSLAQDAENIIQEIKNKNSFLNELIDKGSNSEIQSLYDNISDQEILLADKYRNWALLIFAVIGAFLLLGFLNLSIQNWNHLRDSSYIYIPFGWDSLLKTLMLFSLTTPAWYLTRESSKHRKVAYKAKMLGTELASFPLYAREFKDEDRLELRKILADRFFGQELYNDSSNIKNFNDVSIEQVKLIAEVNKVLAESLKMKQNLS
ncbi:hypothetical protein [Acinetobacter sp. F16]|uniref:hypothetical protein n=1 Tax=Acinetobacter sp. F16 TaxID=3462438 RepID=UPI004046B7F7